MLLKHIVTSQSQLSDLLSQEGIEVTQATLSRDLDEINAMKTRLSNAASPIRSATVRSGNRSAAASGPGRAADVPRAQRLGHIGRVGQEPGRHPHAFGRGYQYVASVIDKQPIDGVLGTIAGDDTVMVICAEDDIAFERSQWLLTLASKN